ncbi:TIGR03364 family FAD-dependent oxidoreductase [Antribacter sp. KLBMP9083]|uniref:TIGR03364 family FAD-dependent oxidoreductase n=1 Tax=Antribacter soli TaxID=2910976 RepID=A0AA41QBN7_9MICO|nr:TIGR03364 family FAD-dependent oxidoreductase [Antribacter soli]MCF4120278.1 TIGR03364 family FAD-dependent oxidoreductase [Antribacter soli]
MSSRKRPLVVVPGLPPRVDLAVVGAGIVGLAHALEAAARGQSVLVLERDDRAVGASVRSLGHAAFTTQDGLALAYALAARERWLRLGREAGFEVREAGTVVVARAEDELAVLDDFVARRDGDARLLDRAGVLALVPVRRQGVVGGAFLPLDVRVDQRAAMAAIARHAATLPGVTVETATTVLGFEAGSGATLVRTTRGDVAARKVVVAVGHDVDRFFPDTARAAGVRRTRLQMLCVTLRGGGPDAPAIDPTVLTGTALLHHAGFAPSPALARVRERLASTRPELLEAGLSLTLTQRPDGTVTLGGTQAHATTHDPFRDEALDDLLLREATAVLGGTLRVVERWTGVHATASDPFLVAEPMPGVRAVAVTSGAGLTTALGLAPRVLDELLAR